MSGISISTAVFAFTLFASTFAEMPKERIQTFTRAWDKAFATADFIELSELMAMVTVVKQDPSAGIMQKLKYKNSEIEDRILLLYRAVCQADMRHYAPHNYKRLLSKELASAIDFPYEVNVDEPIIPGGPEATGDFLDNLANRALSTLNPDIYWHVWFCTFSGELRSYYLGHVNADISLALIVSAERHGNSRNLLRLEHELSINVMNAMQVLTLIAMHSPKIALVEADRIIDFILKYSFEFERDAKAVELSGYLGNDYVLRIQALDLLELVGTKDDLHVVERLKENAPDYTKSFIGGWRMAHPLPENLTVEERAEEVARHLESKESELLGPAAISPE